jgi:hypothetical protein
MTMAPDFMVLGRDYAPAVAVLVMGGPGTDAGWASKTRRTLLVDAGLIDAPFLLLLTSGQIYVWKGERGDPERLPDFQAATSSVLGRYTHGTGYRVEEFGREALRLAVAAWLDDLTFDRERAEDWAVASGLTAAAAGGRVLLESAA